MSYRNVVMNRFAGNDIGTIQVFSDNISGDNSLWNIHGLQLRSNRLERNYCIQRMLKAPRDWRISPISRDGYMFRYVPVSWDRLESKSYAKFRRKLYQGSASLGVTLGTYKQSREMIVSRYKQLNRKAEEVFASTLTSKVTPKKAASIHLEVVFGWVPLLQDIIAAATTVIETAPCKTWIKAVVREEQSSSTLKNWADPYLPVKITNTIYAYHGRGALVTVENPNLWLAERAGLLNPAAVAWDLVPWSFVVNMFVNTGQLVNSITDFAGLSITDGYSFRKANGTSSWVVPPDIGYPYRGGVTQLHWGRMRTQTLGAVDRPGLVFRWPNASWDLAAIAASLFTQKLSRIAGLVKPSHRIRGRL